LLPLLLALLTLDKFTDLFIKLLKFVDIVVLVILVFLSVVEFDCRLKKWLHQTNHAGKGSTYGIERHQV
jgi:hypothetical protein